MSITSSYSRIAAFCGALATAAPAVCGALALWSAGPVSAAMVCESANGPVGPNGEAFANVTTLCHDDGHNTPAARNHFTAIAVSDTKLSWGNSWAQPTLAAAEQVALHNCRQRASDCHIGAWGEYRCIALAIGSDGSWGAEVAMTPGTAMDRALRECRSVGGVRCAVATHPCSED